MRSLIPSFLTTDRETFRDPFQSLRREMHDMMGYIDRRLPTIGTNGSDMTLPVIDIAETKEAIEVSAELPGVMEKDISVTLDRDRLVISGEKRRETEQKGKNFYMMERSFGSFNRIIPLDFEPDSKAVDAQFDKGVLKVTVKKPAELSVKTQQIPVRSATP
jgi:HSP20 family protein